MSKFNELSKIDCGDFIEKKGQLSYISWASAWQILCEHCPDATYEHHEPMTLANGEVMVSCTVTVEGTSHRMHLPVLDYRNKPIQGPNVFQLNTSMQRCFAKAISMHGLGLYVYRGEDLPPGLSPYEETLQKMGDCVAFHEFVSTLSEEDQDAAFNGAPKGEKSKFKQEWRDLMGDAEGLFDSYVMHVREAIADSDSQRLSNTWDTFSDYERHIVRTRLDDEERAQARNLLGVK